MVHVLVKHGIAAVGIVAAETFPPMDVVGQKSSSVTIKRSASALLANVPSFPWQNVQE